MKILSLSINQKNQFRKYHGNFKRKETVQSNVNAAILYAV